MSVLVVGEALVDVVHRADGSTAEHAGGSPYNVARGLSRLGVEAQLVCQFADDDHGHLLAAGLDESHVHHSGPDPTVHRTPTAVATLDDTGAASYEFDLTWAPSTLPDPGAFDALHVGSLGTLIEPGAAQVAELVVTADVLGVPVSFDPNIRQSVVPDPEVWQAVFARFAPHARIVKMSDEDAAVLFPDVAPPDLARRLASEGALVAITQGAGGALVAHRAELAVVEAPAVQVVDTIGAGDTFMAAMLAWSAAYDWPAAAELDVTELFDLGTYAARAAAITCSRAGADLPWLEELNG
jgi:fructokinase